jgi:hypothetical protein
MMMLRVYMLASFAPLATMMHTCVHLLLYVAAAEYDCSKGCSMGALVCGSDGNI